MACQRLGRDHRHHQGQANQCCELPNHEQTVEFAPACVKTVPEPTRGRPIAFRSHPIRLLCLWLRPRIDRVLPCNIVMSPRFSSAQIAIVAEFDSLNPSGFIRVSSLSPRYGNCPSLVAASVVPYHQAGSGIGFSPSSLERAKPVGDLSIRPRWLVGTISIRMEYPGVHLTVLHKQENRLGRPRVIHPRKLFVGECEDT